MTILLLAAFAAFAILAVCLLWRPVRLAVATIIMILIALPAAAQQGGADTVAMLGPLAVELFAIVLMAGLT